MNLKDAISIALQKTTHRPAPPAPSGMQDSRSESTPSGKLNDWEIERATAALCALAASGCTGLSIEETGTALAKALIGLNQFSRRG